MKSKFLLLSFTFLVGGTVFAQESVLKNDFAFGSEIEITNNNSVIDVVLPEDVYRVVKSSALADLAVFNAKNEAVPHILVTPDPKVVAKALNPEDLTLFPIYGAINNESSIGDINVSTSTDGAIVEIKSGRQSSDKVNNKDVSQKIIGYLLDASKIENKVEKLQVSLDAVKDNYFFKVTLEGSQDLKSWSAVELDAVLANFDVNSESLQKNEIELQGSKFAYYRISWRSTDEEIKLVSVKAIFESESIKIEEPLQWKTVSGSKTQGVGDQIAFQYDLEGFYPVSGMKVQFADQNSIARVSIEAANEQSGPWTSIQSSTFFKVIKEGAELSNLEVSFGERRFRFWRLNLNSNLAGVGGRFPEISFGWRPNIVRFLARGEGPFAVAYGSATAVGVAQSDLISGDWTKEVGKGTLNNRLTFGGPEKLLGEKKPEYPIKKIVLWSILLLGVVLLGSMAFQVRKQTQN
jgi:hypothetical protein